MTKHPAQFILSFFLLGILVLELSVSNTLSFSISSNTYIPAYHATASEESDEAEESVKPAETNEPAETNDGLPQISAKSAILMEASTGTICYDKDSTVQLPPASVTKVMTLLLTFEALSAKQIALEDSVTISEHAASMGGSQVFLEPNEIQTVDTLIKCVSIASANDASVALAEYIAGSEEAFVGMMNDRAKALGMNHTHFVNCCGLDAPNHLTCAYDIALMSQRLIVDHPEIFNYCTIWQEEMTHETQKGSIPFTLTNTNKLIRQYPYITGLKTGSTSQAKFCISATAAKDGLTYIAVIMAAENPKLRFSDATTLLNHGFCNTSIYHDENIIIKDKLPLKKGTKTELSLAAKQDFHYLSTTGENTNQITRELQIPKEINAPVKKGDVIGSLIYKLADQKIGEIPVVAGETVPKTTLLDYITYTIQSFLVQ